MAVLVLITSLFIFISITKNPVTSLELCSQISCSPTSQEIRFPFGLNSDNRSCSYPGFGLHCNYKNQTILNLRHSGDFIVRFIYYDSNEIHIRDPGNCLARRFLDGFSLSDSPFVGEFNRSFVFLNCTAKNATKIRLTSGRRVDCLSNENDTVLVLSTYDEMYGQQIPGCKVISDRVEVPVVWDHMAEGDTTLLWVKPDCSVCEQTGGICEFKDGSLGCQHLPSRGLSKGAKYGIIIGCAGVPGLLCTIVIGCYLFGKLKTYHSSRRSSRNLTTTFPHRVLQFNSTTGLDGQSIELYPKTLLGESRRLPEPNHNICPICLCEYQPKETLRTITECNHYFHVECIDEWLRMNATCPLCRNSPDVSSIATPNSTFFSDASSP